MPTVLDNDPAELFLGIGSILSNKYPKTARKVVFGSGYSGYNLLPKLGDDWKIHFVRGPRTAMFLGLDRRVGKGDPATLIRTIPGPLTAEKRSGIAFMPHWESIKYGRWREAAAEAGLMLIDPQWNVEKIISAIRSSETIVTEAMHGAIVADALRVPWIPFAPASRYHHFKWHDWADTLGMRIDFRRSTSSTWFEVFTRLASFHQQTQVRVVHYGHRFGSAISSDLLRSRAVMALQSAARSEATLSSDSAIERVTDVLNENVEAFKAGRRL